MSDVLRKLVARLWWGRAQHITRAIVLRKLTKESAVKLGPLRGERIYGNYTQILGLYEMSVEHAILSNLRSGDVFYDVGANYGYFSLLASHICYPNGYVFAFEPVPQNIQIAEKNCANAPNCSLVEKAVSNVSGSMRLAIKDGVSSSLLIEQKDVTIEVQTTTLDDFIQLNRHPDLIKIDVEGAEIAVLEGAKQLLSSSRGPVIIIEIHDQNCEREIITKLQGYGYNLTPLVDPYRKKRHYPRHLFAKKAESDV